MLRQRKSSLRERSSCTGQELGQQLALQQGTRLQRLAQLSLAAAQPQKGRLDALTSLCLPALLCQQQRSSRKHHSTQWQAAMLLLLVTALRQTCHGTRPPQQCQQPQQAANLSSGGGPPSSAIPSSSSGGDLGPTQHQPLPLSAASARTGGAGGL